MGKLFRYVALGDSTGVGVGASVGGGYPERLYQRMKALSWPAGILNLAQSGAVSADVVGQQLTKAVAVSPHLVTLGIGGNDLWRLVPEATFQQNLNAIADALGQTSAQVVVSNLIDLGHAPVAKGAMAMFNIPRTIIAARVAALNALLSALAGRPRFTVVDLHSLGERELSEHPEFFAADGFHPSGGGYERWAQLLWPSVDAAYSKWRG